MSLEFVSKGFEFKEALQVVDKSRQEVVEFLELMRKDCGQTQLPYGSPPAEAREVAIALQRQIDKITDKLDDHNKKLSVVVEGSLRRVIQLKKGSSWATSAWIRSGSDLVDYIAGLTNESEGWVRLATSQLIDELKNSVCVLTTQEVGRY